MSAREPVTFSVEAEGVGWITFDDPSARANVLNSATLAALASALDAAEASAAKGTLKALAVMGAKEKIFLAGADLKLLAALPDTPAATEFARRGQRLLQRLAECPVPVVCAIHGACAGGGFELALACDWRIASDASVTRVGLPETSLGTIPGWGGCVRLPRLIGVQPALEHILKGQLVSAPDALRIGLVHEVAPVAELKARAKAAALKLAADRISTGSPQLAFPTEFLHERRAAVAKGEGRRNPALLAAIDAVERGAGLPLAEALKVEAKCFGEVAAGAVCKNLIHVFFLRDAAKKRSLDGWFGEAEIAAVAAIVERRKAGGMPAVQRIGVVGAGVMGSGIAQWCAARGFEVVMRDVREDLLTRGLDVVRSVFDGAVKRGKLTAGEANSALQRIATTTAWEGFETCDLVIEAIVEDATAKRALFSELARVVPGDTMLASNTSALPIEEIGSHVANPERTIGLHFFNPVSRMSLVELVIGAKTSAETAARVLAFVKGLGKSPVICRSSPGFLMTRVLFFYLNEAVRCWEQGVATAELDAALRDFGWPMGPLRLIDEVGVDVTDFIFGELARAFPERFERTSACGRLLAAGLCGRKNGAGRGFYRYDGKAEAVNEAETRALAGVGESAGGRRALAENLMRVMAEEAQRCLDEGVVKSADDVDFALLSGAGFPAFRGGLMRWARG